MLANFYSFIRLQYQSENSSFHNTEEQKQYLSVSSHSITLIVNNSVFLFLFLKYQQRFIYHFFKIFRYQFETCCTQYVHAEVGTTGIALQSTDQKAILRTTMAAVSGTRAEDEDV